MINANYTISTTTNTTGSMDGTNDNGRTTFPVFRSFFSGRRNGGE